MARRSEEILATSNNTQFERQKTPAISLDSIVSKMKLDTVNFIRCDIEDAECLMLEGSKMTIEQHLPAFLIEIHTFSLQSNFNRNPSTMLNYFLDIGYEAWRLSDDDSELIRTNELGQ